MPSYAFSLLIFAHISLFHLPHPQTEICVTLAETDEHWCSKPNSNSMAFGPEDLVKTKLIIIVCKKSIDRAL
jgi:hypothetical protein